VAGSFDVQWTTSGLPTGTRIRLHGDVQNAHDLTQCNDKLAAPSRPFNVEAGSGDTALFDMAKCDPLLAPGETLVVRAEAVTSAGDPLNPPVAGEVSLVTAGATSGTLYEPNPVTNADDEASYPHAIQLAHSGSANGTILATFERQLATSNNPGRGWLLYQSTDGGAHFQRLGAPVQPAHFADAFFALQPQLLELARPAGSFAPGTLYLSGNTMAGTKVELQVFRSTDSGKSWQFASTLDLGDTSVSPRRPWEPFLIELDDGRLVGFFSDEITPGGRQNIASKVSTDGGATWGPKANIWESPDNGDRPGMVTVARMGDGRYVMSVEMCGAPGDFCRAHIKTSADGLTWGSGASDMGVRPLTTTNHPFHGNPSIAWTPKGGPKGTLILNAKDLQESVSSPDTPAGDHGQTLLVNYDYGEGAWYELTAAVPWAAGPTNTQAGYRNYVLPLGGGDELLYLTSTYTGAGNRNRVLYATTNPGILPYLDPFAGGTAVGWQPFGGTWNVTDGVYTVQESGLGDKAIAGSTSWTDTTTSADLRLDGAGDAGLIVRATNPSVGIDAYNGYLIGVSSIDSTAFVGRVRYNFSVLGAVHPVAGGVAVGSWYNVGVKAVGCSFEVTVTPASGGAATTFTEADPGCAQTFGAIGVRTHQANASFRNVRVRGS
jgi:hypothetical protein